MDNQPTIAALPQGEVLAPWDPMNMNNPNNNLTNLDPSQAAAWRERERRQRTIRLLMMFLLMLLLMDSEEQSQRKRAEPRHRRSHTKLHLSPEVFGARQTQDQRLQALTQQHARYRDLTSLNGGKNMPMEVVQWATQQAEVVKDEFVDKEALQEEEKEHYKNNIRNNDPLDEQKVFHYPWNATGFYRGEWVREDEDEEEGGTAGMPEEGGSAQPTATVGSDSTTMASIKTERRNKEAAIGGDNAAEVIPTQYIDALSLESEMLKSVKERKQGLGVFLLPPGKEVILRYDHGNFSAYDWQKYSPSSMPPKGSNHYFMRTGDGISSSSGTDSANPKDGTTSKNSHRHSSNSAKDEYNTNEGQSTGGFSNPSLSTSKVTLTKGSGRAAFQLFSRSIPSMQEVSLVDGFLKLYDSNMPGYSTHKDILLRVSGVLIHGIGRMSLVSNAAPGRSVFVLSDEHEIGGSSSTITGTTDAADGSDDEPEEETENDLGHRRRRLEEALAAIDEESSNHDGLPMNQIREDAMAVYEAETKAGDSRHSTKGAQFKFESLHHHDTNPSVVSRVFRHGENNERTTITESDTTSTATATTIKERRTKVLEGTSSPPDNEDTMDQRLSETTGEASVVEDESSETPGKFTWSDIVIPYPFVVDDEEESIRKTKTPAARKMPPREQLLEHNAGICEFEVSMDTKEVEWTVGEWRKLVGRRVKETMDLNPANHPLDADNEESADERRNDRKSRRNGFGASSTKSSKSSREHHKAKPIQDQALIMTMIGSIHSPNCDFTASLNVTALRTDWEHTTGKAINYSFYMMLTCLVQIMILLRQLLHTQAQSAATRVSLLCIGWQTVLDALLCLGHIYLSLAMQPLFTAFASVAFFKLLIFCVIEMKYMALIIQARNSSNGGNSTELLRRQVAMLHLRFYVALFGAFLAFFYAGEKYRIPYNLALYSFWVPQIVQNVITEAKRPMHNYYIYGMSLTRLVAPLYIFAVPNNFLKEVYPESPTDLYMCELLVLWVGIQTAVIIAQGKYGARFMIPARFLPPKFDYSRPIPPSLLPPGATQDMTPDLPLRQSRNSDTQETQSSLLSTNEPVVIDRHTTGNSTRNRIKKGSRVKETTMTAETVVNEVPASASAHTLDCVICYNAIDVHNRRGYMLAPCDHIFHRDCLVQWMDVKMECPICRTELPSL